MDDGAPSTPYPHFVETEYGDAQTRVSVNKGYLVRPQMKDDIDKSIRVERKQRNYNGTIRALMDPDGKLIEKTCSHCNEMKKAEDFYDNKRGYGGKLSMCKSCKITDQVEWRRAKREGKQRHNPKSLKTRPELVLYESNAKKLKDLGQMNVAYNCKLIHMKELDDCVLYIQFDEGVYNTYLVIENLVYLVNHSNKVGPINSINANHIRIQDEVKFECIGKVDYMVRNYSISQALKVETLEGAYQTKAYDMKSDTEAYVSITALGELFGLERDDVKFIASKNRWSERL